MVNDASLIQKLIAEPERLGAQGPAILHETHISWVILAGDHAFKIKKPLDLGFLDYSTLEKRHTMCEREVTLNRRTAPDLYLGVQPITGSAADPVLNGQGPIIEYAVAMRRLMKQIWSPTRWKKTA